MFFSHLTFFFSAIGFLLFAIKSYRHKGFERFLALFSFLYFSLTGIWLFIDSYAKERFVFLDHYGTFVEGFALLLPVVIVYLFNKGVQKYQYRKTILITGLTAISFYGFHLLIKDNSINNLVFDVENRNIVTNALMQIGYNAILFLLFIIGVKKIDISGNGELFDGYYRKVFIALFVVYYSQDILYFLMVIFSVTYNKQYDWLYFASLICNLLVSLLLITLAVYTNWLNLFEKIKNRVDSNIEKPTPIGNNTVFIISAESFKAKAWSDFKSNFLDEYPELIENVEHLDFLSKTEKLYAGILPFNLTHKEVADAFNVSLRTVETNFYRLRTKLKEQQYSLTYPYQPNN